MSTKKTRGAAAKAATKSAAAREDQGGGEAAAAEAEKILQMRQLIAYIKTALRTENPARFKPRPHEPDDVVAGYELIKGLKGFWGMDARKWSGVERWHLRALIKASGMTLGEASRRSGLDPRTIGRHTAINAQKKSAPLQFIQWVALREIVLAFAAEQAVARRSSRRESAL